MNEKKLKIAFYIIGNDLLYRVLEQEGLPKRKEKGRVKIMNYPSLDMGIELRGRETACDNILVHGRHVYHPMQAVNHYEQHITNELFSEFKELEQGDFVFVRNSDDQPWERQEYIATIRQDNTLFYITRNSREKKCSTWEQMKPFSEFYPKRTEEKVADCTVITLEWGGFSATPKLRCKWTYHTNMREYSAGCLAKVLYERDLPKICPHCNRETYL